MLRDEVKDYSIEYPIPKQPSWFKGLVTSFRELYPSRTPSFNVIDYGENAVDELIFDRSQRRMRSMYTKHSRMWHIDNCS